MSAATSKGSGPFSEPAISVETDEDSKYQWANIRAWINGLSKCLDGRLLPPIFTVSGSSWTAWQKVNWRLPVCNESLLISHLHISVSHAIVRLYAKPSLLNTFPHGSFFVRYYSSLLNTVLRISCAIVCSCGIIFVLLALFKAVRGTSCFFCSLLQLSVYHFSVRQYVWFDLLFSSNFSVHVRQFALGRSGRVYLRYRVWSYEYMKIICVNCGVKNYMKEDHRSYIRKVCMNPVQAWIRFRLSFRNCKNCVYNYGTECIAQLSFYSWFAVWS